MISCLVFITTANRIFPIVLKAYSVSLSFNLLSSSHERRQVTVACLDLPVELEQIYISQFVNTQINQQILYKAKTLWLRLFIFHVLLVSCVTVCVLSYVILYVYLTKSDI